MAQTHHLEPKGSWILRILIGVLIIILIASILYPQRLWDKQEALIEKSRARMDNLNYISQRYQEVHDSYISDVDSLLKFVRQDSILVDRATFELDKLSLYQAPYDSYHVDFTDRFHFDHIAVDAFAGDQQVGKQEMEDMFVDSLVLKMIPKQEYENVIVPVRYYIKSNGDLHYYFPEKGEDDTSLIVYGDSLFTSRDYVPYEEKLVPTAQYILNLPLDSLAIDPITGDTFNLNLNTKLVIEGKMDFQMADEVDSTAAVLGDELRTNLFINRLSRQAQAGVEQALQADTTLYDQQIELMNEYFDLELEKILSARRPKRTTVESNTEVVIAIDSLDAYQDEVRLRDMLFNVQYDSLIRVWTNQEKTQEILNKLQYTEEIGVTDVDTVGVTIRPPMDESYPLPSANFLDKVFSVGPVENPGYIENNDLSWSEAR